MKGSITLESSLVFPLIIFTSVLLILYTFFIHDKLVLKSDMYRILMEDYDNDSSASISDIENRLDEKSLLSYKYNINYSTDTNTIQLSTNSSTLPPFSIKLSFTGFERCDYIRQYYTLLHLLHK